MNLSLSQSRVIIEDCILMIGCNIMQVTSGCKHLLSKDLVVFLIISIANILLIDVEIKLNWPAILHIYILL